jgi:hypothetical protein
MIVLNRLSDEVTTRWLAESCPRERVENDGEDLKTRFLSPR